MSNQIELLRYLVKSCEREATSKFNNLLKDFDITVNQSEVLTVIDQYGEMSLKELGNLLVCERQSPSRLVQSLIKKNLIEKVPFEQDKRVSLIRLTSAGEALIPKINAQTNQFNELIASQINNSENLSLLINVLSDYLKNTESYHTLKRRFDDQLK